MIRYSTSIMIMITLILSPLFISGEKMGEAK